MSLGHGSSIVKNGLVLQLDAANVKSYPGSGTVWYDLSGNGNNGTLVNGPTFDSGNKGSIVFDGIDDFVSNTSTTSIPIGNSSRTVQIWANRKTYTSCFVQLGTGGGGNQVYIVQASNQYLFTDGINGSNNLTFPSSYPPLNTWFHFTFGNSGQNWFYYFNGILQTSGTWPTNINTIGQKYVIGKRDDYLPDPSYTNGNASQVSVYNRALSDAEIKQNFNALRGRYGI